MGTRTSDLSLMLVPSESLHGVCIPVVSLAWQILSW